MLDPIILIGQPLSYKGKLNIYPPTIKEVVTNPSFGMFYKLLTITQEDIVDELKDKLDKGEKIPTPFEYLLLNAQYVKGFATVLRESFKFFCKTDINFIFEEKKIIIGNIEEVVQTVNNISEIQFLTEEEFFDFQNIIRQVSGEQSITPSEPFDPEEDPRITEIKRRARERDRIKAKQAGKNGISLSTCLVAICCMGIGITPLNIGEMSYASIGPLMKTMQEKEKYDIDIRSLLAGASSKKVKPKYWIRNTNKE